MVKILKTLIYKCDFFSQKIGLRFKSQSQYSTLTGGIVSILLIVTFFIVFASTIMETINKNSITTQSFQTYQHHPSQLIVSSKDHFYFALGFAGQDMNRGKRYFDIQMVQRQYTSTSRSKTVLKLSACNRSDWESFNNQWILKAYDQVKMDNWLCPDQQQLFQLRGKYSSSIFKFIKISVKPCNQSLDETRICATSKQIQDYLEYWQSFALNTYFVNTLLNPSQKSFVSHFIEDRYYFPFTLKSGISANLFFANYKINTDESIWPTQDINKTTGVILTENAQVIPYLTTRNQTTGAQYLKVYLRKGSNTFIYKRAFRKVDDILSFIGGLFSSIVLALLIVGFYNECSYELEVAKSIYKYDQETLQDTNKFHFLSYLLYSLYSFLKVIGIEPKWSQMQHYDKSLTEVRKQMDIRLVFKKLFILQKSTDVVVEENQLNKLHFYNSNIISKSEEQLKDKKQQQSSKPLQI